MLCVYVAGHRKAAVEDLLCVVHRSLQQVAEVLVLWQLLVACLTPLRHSLMDRQRERYREREKRWRERTREGTGTVSVVLKT